jgi:hypothetical protein
LCETSSVRKKEGNYIGLNKEERRRRKNAREKEEKEKLKCKINFHFLLSILCQKNL